jgi:hypothetical protein
MVAGIQDSYTIEARKSSEIAGLTTPTPKADGKSSTIICTCTYNDTAGSNYPHPPYAEIRDNKEVGHTRHTAVARRSTAPHARS